jgi:hypothetical protein
LEVLDAANQLRNNVRTLVSIRLAAKVRYFILAFDLAFVRVIAWGHSLLVRKQRGLVHDVHVGPVVNVGEVGFLITHRSDVVILE